MDVTGIGGDVGIGIDAGGRRKQKNYAAQLSWWGARWNQGVNGD